MKELFDVHCHMVPGVDDGAADLEESLAMLKMQHEDGVRKIIITPHYRRRMFETPAKKVHEQFLKLQEAAKKEYPDMSLYLGCELHSNMDLQDILEKRKYVTMAGSSYVLLEFSEGDSAQHIRERVYNVLSCGYEPIIAHVERYQATVKDVGFALRKMGVETVNLLLQPQLKEYIDGLVGTENYYVAAYMGDISSELNQKVTLQIFTNEKILCYLRISNSSEVINVMKHEIDMIDFLHEKEVANIPEIIDTSIIGDLHIFAQKSEKKLSEKVKLEFDDRHMKCLKDIMDKTKILCKYEETDLYRLIQKLKSEIKIKFPKNEGMILQHSIRIIENQLKETEDYYAVSHGDFSPWNIYYNSKKEVCMYDFEYAHYEMPEYVDAFHYLTKMSLYGLQNDGDKTIAVYDKYKKLLSQYIDKDTDFVYLCYLIGIISSYSTNAAEKFSIYAYKYLDWIAIVSYLNSRLD